MARHGVLSEFDNAKEEWQLYIAELRKLSNDCDYGESLNEMLRDRLVCGVKDKHIQRRLLAEPAQWKPLKRMQRNFEDSTLPEEGARRQYEALQALW